ncbi:MAG: T9SS type A sorting domain-containing protein [bacterium]|nr:T9SS type A sorting domain-containing protein [bacterium]
MKHLILAIIFSVFLIKVNAQCCRYINIKVKIVEPSTKTVVYSPGKVYYKVRVYNPGFDTIRTLDSFIYSLQITRNFGPNIYKVFKYRFTKVVPKGDSIDIVGNLDITDSVSNPQYNLTVSGTLRNRKEYDIIEETSVERNDNSSDVTFQQVYDPKHTIINSIFKNQLKIFPNPANTIFNISVPSDLLNQTCNIKIIDMQGRLINSYLLSSANSNFQIPIEQLANGNYLILLESETKNFQSILSIQHN